jgi:uncharacterized delta-60 repeat protein
MTWFSRRRRTANGSQTLETLEVRTLLAAGDLDASFGGDGVVDTVIDGQTSVSTQGHATVLLPDGRSLVAGELSLERVFLKRFNADGAVDTSFGTDGTSLVPFARSPRLALDSTGRLLVMYLDGPSTNLRVRRFSAEGTPDNAYAGSGVAELNDAGGAITAVHIGADDRLTIMTGERVTRLNADGTPDTSLGGTGSVTVRISNPVENLTGFAVEPSGAFTVVGYRGPLFNGPGLGASIAVRLTRFGADGRADASFGDQGAVETLIDGFIPNSTGVPSRQTDGSLLVPITVVGGIVVVKFDANGALVTSYGEAGRVALAFSSNTQEAMVRFMPGGDAIVGATLVDQRTRDTDWVFARLKPNGSLDMSFGNGGVSAFDLNSGEVLKQFVVSDAGRVHAVGLADFTLSRLLLARLTDRGMLDSTFDADGYVVHSHRQAGTLTVTPGDAAVQSDGKIVTAGSTSHPEFVVIRHNADGSVDTTFGNAGSVVVPLPPQGNPAQAIVAGVKVDSRGRIVVAGQNGNGALANGYVLRFMPDGTLDASFGDVGVSRIAPLKSLASMVLQADDRIVLAGTISSLQFGRGEAALVRLADTGTVDITFGVGGVASGVGIVVAQDIVMTHALDGKLVMAASDSTGGIASAPGPFVARWFANGSLDTSFGQGGMRRIPVAASINEVRTRSISVDSSGRITVGATPGVVSFQSQRVIRVLADGTFDPSLSTSDFPGQLVVPGVPTGLIVLPDGRYLTAGGQTFFEQDGTNSVFRFNSEFQQDVTWGNAGVATAPDLIRIPSSGHILLPQPDGRILTVGNRSELPGTTSLRLIRLQAEPGVVTSPQRTLTTTETGITATFDVRLSSKPTADVTIPVASSDTTEGTVSVNSLTFTPDNWSTAQSVTITGVDDALFDADQRYRIVLGPATSSDADYNGMTVRPVEVRNRDDETLRFFRAYNPQANFHFFTTSVSEFQGVQPNGYNDESSGRGGFSLVATAQPGFTPLFRLYNLQKGYHYYTASVAEKDFLLSLNPPSTDPNFGKVGWRFEGSPGFIADTQQAGTNQVFRLYNKTSGAHLFTENPAVRAAVLQSPEWEEHAPLGFAFLVDDAEPAEATASPPPGLPAQTESTGTPASAETHSTNVASLMSVSRGTRSVAPPVAENSESESRSLDLLHFKDEPEAAALDAYLAAFDGTALETAV